MKTMRDALIERISDVIFKRTRTVYEDLCPALADAILDELREPTPGMISSALPRVNNPSDENRAIGAAAVRLLGEDQPIAISLAAEMVRDWQAMIDAARLPSTETVGEEVHEKR